MVPMDSINEMLFPTSARIEVAARPLEIECEVLRLFEQFRNPLLRYTLSFGLPVHDAEEVIQEVFLSLFRHLQKRKSRRNLRGWIFRVAHNLALKQRHANQRSRDRKASDWAIAEKRRDPSPDPEEQLWSAQRRRR